jgi:hypothetical protein
MMTLLIVSCRAWRTEDGDCEVTIQSLSLWLENQGSMTKPSSLYPETLNGSLEGFALFSKRATNPRSRGSRGLRPEYVLLW